jgi:Peptidase inhibitor I9
MTASLAAQLAKNANQHVIVMMKSQPAQAKVGSTAAKSRANVIAGNQAPLISELRQVHATHVKSYRLVNSFAATVSKGEVARLKANAGVAKVIPDVTIRGGSPEHAATLGAATAKTTAAITTNSKK